MCAEQMVSITKHQRCAFHRQRRRFSGELQRPRAARTPILPDTHALARRLHTPPRHSRLESSQLLRCLPRLLVACLLALAWAAAAPSAAAAPTAPGAGSGLCAQHDAWAARCAAPGFQFEVTACLERVVVVSARTDSAQPLSIEIADGNAKAFRRVGSVGIQPIGEFPDWNQEPAARQDALARTVSCVERFGPPDFAAPAPRPTVSGPRLLVLGLLLLLCSAGLALRLRRGRSADRPTPSARDFFLAEIAGLAALTLATGWLRWWLVGPAPFHQNGQAPLWIADAAGAPLSPSVYGPGFQEVFGWFASRGEPDYRVPLLQSALLAASVPLAHLVVRVAGAGRGAAWLASFAICAHPLLARLAGSESYMATMGGLGMLAAASLALAAQPGEGLADNRPRLYLFLCGIIAAGCFVAQAARVHPIGWLPLATLAFVVPCLGGSLKARALRGSIAGLTIAALVCLTSLGPMLGVLRGELGQRWLPATSIELHAAPLLLLLPLWLLTKRRAQDWIPVVALCLCWELAPATNAVGDAPRMIRDAYLTLYLPAVLVALAAYLPSLAWDPLRQFSVVACAAAPLAFAWSHWAAYLKLPTDAQEVQLLTKWLREMPKPGAVLYLGRAGQRVLLLPRYDATITIFSAETDKPLPPFQGPRGLRYYRSSLCSTDEGKATCQALESQLVLEPEAEVELPALASLPYLPLPPGYIKVGWYKVKGTRH